MIDRAPVGDPIKHQGRTITATLMQPDLLGQIDGQEMPHFYLTLHALQEAAKRMIDADIKEKEEKRRARRSNDR